MFYLHKAEMNTSTIFIAVDRKEDGRKKVRVRAAKDDERKKKESKQGAVGEMYPGTLGWVAD